MDNINTADTSNIYLVLGIMTITDKPLELILWNFVQMLIIYMQDRFRCQRLQTWRHFYFIS